MADQHHEVVINVLVFREIIPSHGYDGWVAQGLEHNIVAQGRNKMEAIKRFSSVFVYQAIMDIQANKVPLSDFKPAPDNVREKFNAAEPMHADYTFPTPENVPFPFQATAKDMRVYA